MMRKTAQEGGSTKEGGFLTKAGATAMGLDKSAPNAFNQTTGNMSNGTTQHWKSSYKNTIEESTNQAGQRSQPPEWSLPRQAYTSKRSYFVTESMKSFGTYGNNPL